MAKPFALNPRQARQQKRDLAIKDQIVLATQKEMNVVLRDAIEQVYAGFTSTGKFKPPNLDAMDAIGERFYKRVVAAAVKSAQDQSPKKRLAKLPEGELPEGASALDKVLRNRRYWQSIMKRKRALIGKAKTAYLDRLKRQFQKVLPLLESTDLSPREAKKKIAEAWHSGRARTETIFRTETTRYFAKSQVAYFEDNSEIIGFLFDSVRDTSRTGWCQSRHGLVYRPGSELLATNTPPCHWNCRSHLIPLVNDNENRKMLKDPNRDPTHVKVVPLPPGWKS